MNIDVWVPLGMDVLSTLTFGRSDARILIGGVGRLLAMRWFAGGFIF